MRSTRGTKRLGQYDQGTKVVRILIEISNITSSLHIKHERVLLVHIFQFDTSVVFYKVTESIKKFKMKQFDFHSGGKIGMIG